MNTIHQPKQLHNLLIDKSVVYEPFCCYTSLEPCTGLGHVVAACMAEPDSQVCSALQTSSVDFHKYIHCVGHWDEHILWEGWGLGEGETRFELILLGDQSQDDVSSSTCTSAEHRPVHFAWISWSFLGPATCSIECLLVPAEPSKADC